MAPRELDRAASRRGSSLIEVLVCIVLLSIALMGIYGVCITSLRGATYFTPYDETADSIDSLRDVLKNYVTADASAATASYAPDGSWRLPGDTCATALQTVLEGCAEHTADQYLSSELLEKYPAATFKYTVTRANSDAPINVSFTVRW